MKKVVVRGVLVVSGTLVALILTECILRTFHPFSIDYNLVAPYRFSCYRPGTYYWSRYQTNKTCILKPAAGAFPDVTFSLNSLGLRNREITLSKPPDTTRILFIGDSFIAGWGVAQDEALPQQTERLLSGRFGPNTYETINAGLSGSGPGYSYLFLKNDGMKLDPDVIVVGFYMYNDLAEDLRETVWINPDQYGLPQAVKSTTSYVDYAGNMRRHGRPIKMAIPLLEQSYVYDLVTDQLLRIFPERFGRTSTVALYCVFKKTCHDLDTETEKAKILFLGMQRLAKEANKKLIVLLIPAEFQIHPEKRLQFGIPVSLSPEDVRYPSQKFGTFFQQNGISYIDLLPTFQAHATEPLYFELDEHWTPLGTTLAAQTIVDYIASESGEKIP